VETIILGIDPGFRSTGYGVVKVVDKRLCYLVSGCIHAKSDELGDRLGAIFSGITDIIEAYCPTEVAVEKVFMHRYVDPALKLGYARGAALSAAAVQSLLIAEYTAKQIKQSVVGYGAAEKQQMQHMVKVLLNLSDKPQEDAADALAAALCHAQVRTTLQRQQEAINK
jgi:crossover junction endodeoxyribonuclease RuvC